MKVVTFFMSKGGTGKTSFNIMFASYLTYILGRRVLVLDVDFPEYNLYFYREREKDDYLSKGKELPENIYPIEQVQNVSDSHMRNVVNNLKRLAGAVDYVIVDFPGSFTSSDAICRFIEEESLDLVVMPVEVDGMVMSSARSMAKVFKETGVKCMVFLNRVDYRQNESRYVHAGEWFDSEGVTFSRNRVKGAAGLTKDMKDNGFVRSSLCFPMKKIMRENPGVVGLFEEVMRYVEMGEQDSFEPDR